MALKTNEHYPNKDESEADSFLEHIKQIMDENPRLYEKLAKL